MYIYSKEEYILLSKINSEKIVIENKKMPLINLFVDSIKYHKNIFKSENQSWLFDNCEDKNLLTIILKYNDIKFKEEAALELENCKKNNIKLLMYESKRFPSNLKKITFPPIMLYYQGNFPKDISLVNSTSVIGSRNCYENFGGKLAYKIGEKLATEKKWNISGLALGIDTFGHKGSLSKGGYTGAFIAQGLLTPLYPKENLTLKKEIIKKGGFIATEYPIYSKPYYKKFTLRNRLQAGIVDFLIIPEFNEKSGTLSTIEYGLKEKKEVYICSPEKTLQRETNCKEFNKGNILFAYNEDTLKKIYPNFNSEAFKKTRLYKIKNNKNYKYEIIYKIPKFEKNNIEIEQVKLF